MGDLWAIGLITMPFPADFEHLNGQNARMGLMEFREANEQLGRIR